MNTFYRELAEAGKNIKETGTIEYKENLFKDLAGQVLAMGDERVKARDEAISALHMCQNIFDPSHDYTEDLNTENPFEKELVKTYCRGRVRLFKILIDIDKVALQMKTRHTYEEEFENILVITNETGAEVIYPSMVKLCLSLVPTLEISNMFVEAWKKLEHEHKRAIALSLNKACKDIVEGRCTLTEYELPSTLHKERP